MGGVTSVATALGVARNTLYNWMEKENIPANKLLELGGLGADVSYILSGVSVQPPKAAEPQLDEPLARRKAKVKQMMDQIVDRISDDRGLDEIQVELAKIERMKDMERELAELRQKAG
jgi:hypothetical protein